MTDITPQQPLHPLRAKELRLIPSWSEWKKLWEAEVHPERLIGLLHIGFDVPLKTYASEQTYASERILFYLSIADGHTSDIGSWEEQNRELGFTSLGRNLTWAEIRQRVAQKAFQELCRHLFKNTERPDQTPSWFRELTEDSCHILDAVLDFFLERDLESGPLKMRLRNLLQHEKSHEHEIAASFLEELCIFAGSYPQPFRERDAEIEKNLRQRRPQFVRILVGLNKFALLRWESPEDLDDACYKMLKRLALGTELYLPTEPSWEKHLRLPNTLEEALTGGSGAAKILLLHGIRLKEHKRFAQLGKLASQQQAAARAIERLSPRP